MTYFLSFRSKIPLSRSDALPRGSALFFSPTVFQADPPRAPQNGLFPLERTTKAFEDQRHPFWRSATGMPARWMVFSGRQVRLVPASALTVIVGYQEAPVLLASDEDVPDTRIPVPHHAYLKFAAAAWLLRQDGDQRDESRSQALMQTFNALIGANRG
jgi:hypothetical protein